MSQDTQVLPGPGTHAEIWLRVERFEEAAGLLGCTTDVARAELVGMSDRQLRRVKAQRPVGDQVVAKILLGLRRAGLTVTFDDLFEIREVKG